MTTEKPAAPLSTSDGARCYIAHFFAREMRRHDFTTYIATELAADFACALAQYLAATGKQPVGEVHPDDVAVDAFADAMKQKMAGARAKGRGGWEDPAQCSAVDLTRLLRDHVEKGDPRDVANFCMMLHQRGESIVAYLDLPYMSEDEVQPVGEVQGDARAQFEAWARWFAASVARNDEGDYASTATNSLWCAWQAAIAARQPVRIYGCCAQPDGELHTAECPNMRHLAARQPGAQEPFGYCADFDPAAHEFSHTFYYLAPGEKVPKGCTAFYTAPPAQGIDLGQLRKLADRWERTANDKDVAFKDRELIGMYDKGLMKCVRELRAALIDQRDAAPGVGNG